MKNGLQYSLKSTKDGRFSERIIYKVIADTEIAFMNNIRDLQKIILYAQSIFLFFERYDLLI